LTSLALLKTLLAFVHLLAMAVAVGRIILFDLQFPRQLHRPPTLAWRQDLDALKTTIKAALAVLWLSGGALVWLAVQQDPAALQNEKLWMKVLTVALLTANGYLMHRFALPALRDDVAFLARPGRQVALLTAFAVTSSVSWLFASFLGIARGWNHSIGIGPLLGLFGALMALALLGGLGWMFALRALPQRVGAVQDVARHRADPPARAAPVAGAAPRRSARQPVTQERSDVPG
jgi:hypothetical protein